MISLHALKADKRYTVLAAIWVLLLYNIFLAGNFNTLLPTIAVILVTVLVDLAFVYYLHGKKFGFELEFPLSAAVTGSIISVIVTPSWNTIYVPLVAAIFALASKHFIRIKEGNIFNPANFGILIVTAIAAANVFPGSQTWWAATPWWFVLPLAAIVAYRINGLLVAVPFLIFISLAGLSSSVSLAAIAAPFASGTFLFFAGVMLVEPMTAPRKPNAKIAYAVLAGVFFYLLSSPAPDFSLAGALALANLIAKPLDRYLPDS